MELAMSTSSSLRCRTGAFRFSGAGSTTVAGDRRRGCRTTPVTASSRGARRLTVTAAACKTCKGKGAVECPGYKGTDKNKKCFDCQGFGLKSCPTCGKGGLTPEQRG